MSSLKGRTSKQAPQNSGNTSNVHNTGTSALKIGEKNKPTKVNSGNIPTSARRLQDESLEKISKLNQKDMEKLCQSLQVNNRNDYIKCMLIFAIKADKFQGGDADVTFHDMISHFQDENRELKAFVHEDIEAGRSNNENTLLHEILKSPLLSAKAKGSAFGFILRDGHDYLRDYLGNRTLGEKNQWCNRPVTFPVVQWGDSLKKVFDTLSPEQQKDFFANSSGIANRLESFTGIVNPATAKAKLNDGDSAKAKVGGAKVETVVNKTPVDPNPEVTQAREEFFAWFAKDDSRLGKGDYDALIAKMETVTKDLPKKEITLHADYFRFGFSLFYVERPGEDKYMPIGRWDGLILNYQAGKDTPKVCWPLKDPQDGSYFLPNVTLKQVPNTHSGSETTGSYLRNIFHDVTNKTSRNYRIFEGLSGYAKEIQAELGNEKYKTLRKQIPSYPELPDLEEKKSSFWF